MNISSPKTLINNIKNADGRKIIRKLSNPDSLMATVLLEGFVTGGRGINAYKRGGEDELRERVADDVVSAVFWMKGVDIFNSMGDKFGKKCLNLPTTEFDVGHDALRNPFKNLQADINNKLGVQKAKSVINKLSVFKFTKIISATLLSTAVIGYIMPRINQKVTDIIMKRKKLNESVDNSPLYQSINERNNKKYSFEEFDKRISADKSGKVQSFKGLSEVSHMLENNTICKMLTNDAGIITGRTISARNKDEGLEYMFRDISSLFFYFASTPLIYSLLQKITSNKNLTEIDPVAAQLINNNLKEQLNNSKLSVEEFKNKTLGNLDKDAKNLIDKMPFKSDVITLKEFCEVVKDKELCKKAEKMSKLQPMQAEKGSVLTKQQVLDVFKNGSISQHKFMENIFRDRFGDSLFDKYRYISMKKITDFRENIDRYVQGVIETAEKENNGFIDIEFLEKVNKKSYKFSAGFRSIALGISALSLGFVIPKLQYALTELRTGSKSAPMFREYENNDVKA